MSQYDLNGLYEFLQQTPEQGLRKMLVDQKPMGDAHFNLLMKIVRGCSCEDFCSHVDKSDFPKIKMGPAEQKIKDKFWADCFQTFAARGILNPGKSSTAA
jgi:hypothetical protein